MDKRKIIVRILVVFMVTIFFSCLSKNKEQKQDSFYENFSGWGDWLRIPLIKPYELMKVNPSDRESEWDISFVNSSGTYNVKKVDVKDSIIFLLSGKVGDKDEDSTIVNNRNVPTGWFIIDTQKKIEKGFFSEKDFYDYIKDHKYPSPSWRNVDSLSNSISKDHKLPWRH